MFNYNGQVCDVCGKPFDKDSDIVVCPECGTPHHRECYASLGHCVNESKHSEGFEWQPIRKEPKAGSITCPDCGAIMPRNTLFCENCGKALKTPQSQPQINVTGGALPGMGGFVVMSRDDVAARIERELAGEIDGVPLKDIAVFIGSNAQYYLYKFRKMEQNPKYKPFNLTACLFSPLYFLFRKMWKVAAISILCNFVFSIPSLIIMAVNMGLLSISSRLVFPGIETVASVCSLISMLIGILWGFLAIPLYKKDTIKRLKKMKADCGSDVQEYYRQVMTNAGPSKLGMFVTVLFMIMYIFTMFSQY